MNQNNAARRTLQKVRRDSRPVGTCEAAIWRPTSSREMGQAIKAAERFDRTHKPKGKRNGPLGHVGLEVYRALWSRVRFSDGCLCPSLEWLMKACRRSKAAIVDALRRLKAKGFVSWTRRLERTGGPPGVRGPQVKQATNAYALGLPGEALALLAAPWLTPADELNRAKERAAFVKFCERAAFSFSPIGEAFAAWERALLKRESAGRSQSLPRHPLASAGRA